MSGDRKMIHEDKKNRRFLWTELCEGEDPRVHFRLGIVHMELTDEEARELYRMLHKWVQSHPVGGWDDHPMAV